MARARNIKPGFFHNDLLVDLPFETRLLFIGIWTIADRSGRLLDRAKKIRMEIFPADNVDVEEGLCLLEKSGFILRYEAEGNRVIQVINWDKHQSPHHKEVVSSLPPPPSMDELSEASLGQAPDESEASLGQAPSLPVASRPDTGYRIPDTGYLITDTEASASQTPARMRAREGAFPIFGQWEPSEGFWDMAKRSGHNHENPDYADALTDFIAYWLTNPGVSRTQSEWEKSFLQSWKNYRTHASSPDRQPRKRPNGLSPHNDFEKRDYTQGINADGSF